MARRNNGKGSWGFNIATVVQVFAIPLFSGIVYLIVQWVTQGDTLKHHDAEIQQNQVDIKKEADQREKTRAEFLDKLGKLNDSMNTLNTNVALQGQVLGAIKEELQKRNTDRGR